MRKVMSKTFEIISYIGLAAAFVLLCIAIYWWTFPYKTIDVYLSPMPVETEVVQFKDAIPYHVVFCRYTNAPANVARYLQRVDNNDPSLLLVDEQISRFPISEEDCNENNPDDLIIGSLKMPELAEKGEYRAIIRINYQMNPLRGIPHEFETSTFEYVP